ncbi:hypothetical protein GCM10009789_86850 [Kribbella sancticallisti]|uniref:Uncharacterized protein n=1 Tax=Kribbella sancticallisti TaxID=460087 RepID=A0ABN2EWA6_9ACTN
MPHDHNLAAITHRVNDGIGVLSPAGQAVVDGQVDGHCAVPTLAKFSRDQMPVPAAATTTVHKYERGHSFTLATYPPNSGTAVPRAHRGR